MKRSDIRVGGLYWCKVSGRLVKVEIAADLGVQITPKGKRHRGYTAKNTLTGKTLQRVTAARLRSEAGRDTHMIFKGAERAAERFFVNRVAKEIIDEDDLRDVYHLGAREGAD